MYNQVKLMARSPDHREGFWLKFIYIQGEWTITNRGVDTNMGDQEAGIDKKKSFNLEQVRQKIHKTEKVQTERRAEDKEQEPERTRIKRG